MANDTSAKPASEINPYASPRVVDPYEPFAEAGVGVWRDGDEVVMHRQAELPKYCVVTGEPADAERPHDIGWSEPVGGLPAEVLTLGRRLILKLPLTSQVRRDYDRPVQQATVAVVAALAIAVVALATMVWLNGEAEDANPLEGFIKIVEAAPAAVPFAGKIAVGAIIVLAVGFWAAVHTVAENRYRQWLQFSRISGNYLWLRGPSSQFLDRLPRWPYGR